MTATERALNLAQTAAQAAADKLAKDILIIDVSDRLAITDCFVVVTGTNERQVSSIVDSVEEKMRDAGEKPVRREGERDGRWVLLDFLDVVVHVQHSEERVFYALDRLWKDCPSIPFVDADAPAGSESASSSPSTSTGADSEVPDAVAVGTDGSADSADQDLDTDTDTDTDTDGYGDGDGDVDADLALDADLDSDAEVETGSDDSDLTADPTDDTLDVADEAGDLAAGAPGDGTEGAVSSR